MYKLIEGDVYITRGGWEATCVYIPTSQFPSFRGGHFVHKKDSSDEFGPVWHEPSYSFEENGILLAKSNFSVNEPPSYGEHPADIVSKKNI